MGISCLKQAHSPLGRLPGWAQDVPGITKSKYLGLETKLFTSIVLQPLAELALPPSSSANRMETAKGVVFGPFAVWGTPAQHLEDWCYKGLLEGTARYAGLLLAPAEGFGLRQRAFLPLGQKKSLFMLKKSKNPKNIKYKNFKKYKNALKIHKIYQNLEN